MMRKKSADTIGARVNVYHSTRGRIYDCISTYLAKKWWKPIAIPGRVHIWL